MRLVVHVMDGTKDREQVINVLHCTCCRWLEKLMIIVVMIIRFFMRQGFHNGADRSHISEPSVKTKFAMSMNVRWHSMYCMGLSDINHCYRSEDEGRTSFLPTCR